jgi:transcriptional regulator with XRE-family HTH domain
MNDLFGARLRRERERQQIPLAAIADQTKINASLFEALERGDVSRWPSGIFRRAFVRAYAEAIGLDPNQVLREFLDAFPAPEEPQTRRPRSAPSVQTPDGVLRLTFADAREPFWDRFDVRKMRQRLAAVLWDAGALGVLGVALFIALGTFWMPFAIAAVLYYMVGILVLGNTPGVCLLGFVAGRRATHLSVSSPGPDSEPELSRAAGTPLGIGNWELGIRNQGN